MSTGEERLQEILTEEADVLTTESRQLYIDVSKKLKVSPKLDDALIIITRNTVSKKYLEASLEALEKHKAVILVAKGPELNKLVSVVEQIKQKGDVKQLNKLTQQLSLINPSYSPQHSINNIKVFFGDDLSSQDAEKTALREIKGHKVYDVPVLSVLLVKVEVNPADFAGWTIQ